MDCLNRLVIFIFALLISGCTETMWNSNPSSGYVKTHDVVVKDRVSGFYKYNNLKIQINDNGVLTRINVPENGVAFIGQEKVYVLGEGEEKLIAVAQVMETLPVEGFHDNDVIEFEARQTTDPSVLIFEKKFRVKFKKNPEKTTPEVEKILLLSGFKENQQNYYGEVKLKGYVFNRDSIDGLKVKIENKITPTNVELYISQTNKVYHPLNIATKIVWTPVTVAADIILIPLAYGFWQIIKP
jgi:hypothetical protein